MIYLDPSALVKLIFDEAESEALDAWLRERSALPKVTSELSTIELVRVCRRRDEEAVADARGLLGGLDLIPIAVAVVERATAIGPPDLRSLDAIHLASALSIKDDLISLVTYDQRLVSAAVEQQIHVATPAG